jgi:hypothetical protein
VNLSGDDDIRNQRERGGNQHRPLARLVGIGDCDFIHGVEVTGACRRSDAAVATTRHVAAWKGSPHTGRAARVAIPKPAFGTHPRPIVFAWFRRPSADQPDAPAQPLHTVRAIQDDDVELAVVHKGRWPDLEQLFDARGGPKSCWCMIWRDMPERPQRTAGPSRKRALKNRVQAGQQVGLLANAIASPRHGAQ